VEADGPGEGDDEERSDGASRKLVGAGLYNGVPRGFPNLKGGGWYIG
jgi:hypothetical protein